MFCRSQQVIDPLGAASCVPEKIPSKAVLVEAKWFWVSIQMDICASDKLYPYKEVLSFIPMGFDQLILKMVLIND